MSLAKQVLTKIEESNKNKITESKSLDLIKALYKKNQKVIDAAMVKAADDFLKSGKSLTSSSAFTFLFDDGAFRPFSDSPGSEAYDDYVAENGNEEDESDYLTQCWIDALTAADSDKYKDIIAKFVDIKKNGL